VTTAARREYVPAGIPLSPSFTSQPRRWNNDWHSNPDLPVAAPRGPRKSSNDVTIPSRVRFFNDCLGILSCATKDCLQNS
jgi:hypothetical protein